MVNQRASITLKGLTIATVAVAVWLLISPFVLSFVHLHYSMWNSFIIAFVVAWIAGVRVSGGLSSPWLSGISALIGLWLIASPWIWGNSGSTAVLVNDIVVGIILAGLGVLSVLESHGQGPALVGGATLD